jgi:uncharacterized protein (TIRG00374 family)
MENMSFKSWLNIVTIVLVLLVLFFARNDIVKAWQLLGQVNLAVFALIIPVQFLSYYAHGAMIFSYLRARGDLQKVHWLEQPKMALELNFVNHIFPTAGVSGASYMTWRLNKLGESTGRATLAQVVKFAMTFLSFAALLVVAVLMITADGDITRQTILVSSSLVSLIIAATVGMMYLLNSKSRLEKFAAWVDLLINKKIAKLLRKKEDLIATEKIEEFICDMHEDYLTLKHSPKTLVKPFFWGVVFNLSETAMFFVTFLALGAFVNPATILIAAGIAGLVSVFVVTPGGVGGYEAIMILFLTSAGVAASVAVAGVVLARTTLVLLTILSGYIFYHLAIRKYGKSPATSQ